jgi:hypothetical protein
MSSSSRTPRRAGLIDHRRPMPLTGYRSMVSRSVSVDRPVDRRRSMASIEDRPIGVVTPLLRSQKHAKVFVFKLSQLIIIIIIYTYNMNNCSRSYLKSFAFFRVLL